MDSQMKFYSFGRVAENKPQGTDMIQVVPIEQFPMLDGELKSDPKQVEIQGVDASGSTYSSQVTVDSTVDAKWFPMATNRKTSPNVRRGERVIVWRYADTDKYYWTELGWDDHLRRLETVVYTFSGTTDESLDATLPENCYSLEVSTHKGAITLQTSKKNGEYCKYVVQINTKDGKIVVTDDLNNVIMLDSQNTLIEFTNALNTTLQLDKQKIYAHADDSISLDAKNLIHLTTKDFKMECTTVTVKCSTIEVDNDTTTFNTTDTTFNGAVNVNGTFAVTAGNSSTFGGTCQFDGTCKFTQAVEFTAPIKAAGIVSSAAIQGPSQTI